MHNFSIRLDCVVKPEQEMQTSPGSLPQGSGKLCSTCQTQLLCHTNHGWHQHARCSFSICGTATTEQTQHRWLQRVMARLEKSQFGFRSCTISYMVTVDAQLCNNVQGHAVQRGLYLAVTAAVLP